MDKALEFLKKNFDWEEIDAIIDDNISEFVFEV